jgi:ATP-binding cassette subfamily C protein
MDGDDQLMHWARRRLAAGFAAALLIGLAMGLLVLAVPLYSIQLFDRVLTSGHEATLVLLSLVLVLCLVTFGALEAIRASLMARLATRLAAGLEARLVAAALSGRRPAELSRAIENLRQCLTGPLAQAVGDAPWLPLAVGILWLVHPLLGWLALASATLLLVLAVLAERFTRHQEALAADAGARGRALLDAAAAIGPTAAAPGMEPAVETRHRRAAHWGLVARQRAAERAGLLAGVIRALRLLAQAAVMGLGAWLVLRNAITPGTMLGASILLARALAPVEQLVAAWRPLGQARAALGSLRHGLAASDGSRRRPEPDEARSTLRLEAVGLDDPNGRPILDGIDLDIRPGEVLAVVGASGAGKSSLCSLIAGAVAPSRGIVRSGGTDRALLDRATLGALTGYLPQEPRFLPATVAENIARMADNAPFAAVVAAARGAGVHDSIQRRQHGYESAIEPSGAPLSGGERQRVALARALYGSPTLVVLDEPDAHQDATGGAMLARALACWRERGAAVVIATHRPGLLASADRLLVIENGRMAALGPTASVMKSLQQPAARAA